MSADHFNYVGQADACGNAAVSMRREPSATDRTTFQYRIIVRTSKLGTQWITIPEAAIPTKSSHCSPTVAEVLARVLPPELPVKCLHQARVNVEVPRMLQQLDECVGSGERTYKVGSLYCDSGQSTEEHMYGNRQCSSGYQSFLDAIAGQVELLGFEGFRGGLDTKDGQTGSYSYYTEFGEGYQIMFHVASLLPYTECDPQQVLRKRHIGNNIVTVVFLVKGAEPFDVGVFLSKFQHIFILVRDVSPDHSSPRYEVATVRKGDVPAFGPALPVDGIFDATDITTGVFKEFLLTKIINAENAGYRSIGMTRLSQRTRTALLEELTSAYDSGVRIPGIQALKSSVHALVGSLVTSVSSALRRGSMISAALICECGKLAMSWQVKLHDVHQRKRGDVHLVLSENLCVVFDSDSQVVLHQLPSKSILGWIRTSSLDIKVLYGSSGESLSLMCCSDAERIAIEEQLAIVSPGTLISSVILERSNLAQVWGLHLADGQISSVGGIAKAAGLARGATVLRINGVTVTHSSGSSTTIQEACFELLVEFVPGKVIDLIGELGVELEPSIEDLIVTLEANYLAVTTILDSLSPVTRGLFVCSDSSEA